MDDEDDSDLHLFDDESEGEAMDLDETDMQRQQRKDEEAEDEIENYNDDAHGRLTEQICLSTLAVVRRYATPAEAAHEMRIPNVLGKLMRKSMMPKRGGFGWQYCRDRSVPINGIC